MSLEAWVRAILRCPACHAELTEVGPTLVCQGQGCGLRFPVRDGIPVLLVDEAAPAADPV